MANQVKYYAKIDLDEKEYFALVKIEDGAVAYAYGQQSGKWNQDNYFLEAKIDTTSFDEISEEKAQELIKRWSQK